jgi:hypothetical protein
MPQYARLNLAQGERAQMLAALRRARYGYLLALHVLLLCAAGHTPTEIATKHILVVSIITGIGFLAPWGLVRLIAWIIEGFRSDRLIR